MGIFLISIAFLLMIVMWVLGGILLAVQIVFHVRDNERLRRQRENLIDELKGVHS